MGARATVRKWNSGLDSGRIRGGAGLRHSNNPCITYYFIRCHHSQQPAEDWARLLAWASEHVIPESHIEDSRLALHQTCPLCLEKVGSPGVPQGPVIIMGSANDPMAGLLSGLDGLGGMFAGPKSMKDMRSPAGQQRSSVPSSTPSRMGALTPGQTDQRWNASQAPLSGRASGSLDPFAGIPMNPSSDFPSTTPAR